LRAAGLIIFQGMQDSTAESIKSLEGFDIAWVEEARIGVDRDTCHQRCGRSEKALCRRLVLKVLCLVSALRGLIQQSAA
jgi:hypothetical protein